MAPSGGPLKAVGLQGKSPQGSGSVPFGGRNGATAYDVEFIADHVVSVEPGFEVGLRLPMFPKARDTDRPLHQADTGFQAGVDGAELGQVRRRPGKSHTDHTLAGATP